MDWSNWKTWALAAAVLVAMAAIYVFASPEAALQTPTGTSRASPFGPVRRPAPTTVTGNGTAANVGIEPVHLERLEPPTGKFQSRRNLFNFVEPPPPPPPPVIKPQPPPDQDGDGVP